MTKTTEGWVGRSLLACLLALSHPGCGGAAGSPSGPGSLPDGGSATTAPPTAAELLALTSSCTEVTKGRYATDEGEPASVAVCALDGALFWRADMDVDCDGKTTSFCNASTDPWYQAQTSATDSKGQYLDAAALPFVVVPLPSARFSYSKSGLELGSVIAVVYGGQVDYGVFGDEGPQDIIGEASYAMAKSLGIDPDPATGGAESGVTYIAFTGASAVVSRMEDHAEAVQLGQARALQLLGR